NPETREFAATYSLAAMVTALSSLAADNDPTQVMAKANNVIRRTWQRRTDEVLLVILIQSLRP
ncbi:MAG: hypothetical protein DME80_00325, partial [Verrucomicrobia bacterium]